MSETKTDENAGHVDSGDSHHESALATGMTTSSEAGNISGPASGAVDTGRRIDPALLKGGAAPARTIRRAHGGSDASPEATGDAPEVVVTSKAEIEARATAAREARPPEARGNDAPHARDDRGPPRPDNRSDTRGPPGASNRGPPGANRGPGGSGGPGGKRDNRGGPGGKRDDKRAGPRPDQRRDAGRPEAGPKDVYRTPTSVEDAGDFAAMLAESGPVDHVRITVGDRAKAKVVHISKDTVFFQVSGTQEAFMPTAELLDDEGSLTVKIGDTVEAFVVSLTEGILLSRKLGRGEVDIGLLEQARMSGIPIDGTVTAVNKGGVEVTLAGTRGFCPTGQLDINFVEDPATLIGKSLSFLIREVKEGGRQLVLSRKMLQERERKEKSKKLLATLAAGQVLQGTVTRIQPFGVFVDIGGIDGLIPMSELSYARVNEAGDVVQVGEQVQIEVLRIEENPKRQGELRIALSLKATQPDPFVAYQGELQPGNTLIGRIVRLEPFGAFVELFPGVQGLVHVSELADQRIRHPEDVLKLDEAVKVRVLDYDLVARRVSLSLREPQDVVSESPDTREAQVAQRPGPKGPRRGDQVEGTVDRVEKYGVFVQLEGGGAAFLPASESGTPRGSDMARVLPIGTKMSLLVIEVDDRNRLKVSRIAREVAEERALVNQYKTDNTSAAGFGTFGDLLKKARK